jgi:hypothetical protein
MLARLIQVLRDKDAVFSRMEAAVESDQRYRSPKLTQVWTGHAQCLVPASSGFPACEDSFTCFSRNISALSSPQAFYVSEERACHTGTKPALHDVGAEQGLGIAQPGFQHRQQSSTNGLARQPEPNATTGETCQGTL